MKPKNLLLGLAVVAATASVFPEEKPSEHKGEDIVMMEKLIVMPFMGQLDLAIVTDEKPVRPTSKLFAVLIMGVKPKSPAEQAGIKPGMALVAVKRRGDETSRQSFANPRVGELREVGEVKESLKQAGHLLVTREDVQKGWVDLDVDLMDRWLKDSKHFGKFTVTFRVKLGSEVVESPANTSGSKK